MRFKKVFLYSSMLLGLASMQAFGDIGSDLNNFFGSSDFISNDTSPGSFHDQQAGYYSGGSLSLRHQVREFQIASIQLPSFSGGCGGIDMFLGSFSMMSSAQLTTMIKNIMSSAGAYAMDVALAAAVPQLKAVKDRLESMMHQINSMSANSCEIGQDLVGGLFPKMQGSQQQICKDLASQPGGPVSDWAAAKQDCGTTGGDEQKNLDNSDAAHKPEIDSGNIVWQALEQDGIATPGSDPQLAEFMMTLTGTVVVDTTTNPPTFMPIAGQADDESLFNGLLHGTDDQGHSVKILTCDELTKCLKPTLQDVSLSKAQALETQVTDNIQTLADALKSDTAAVSPTIQNMIETVPLPILSWIDGELSQGRDINPSTYADIISTSLLQQYLLENIHYVRQALDKSKDSETKEKMLTQIQSVEANMNALINQAYASTISSANVIGTMRASDGSISATASSSLDSSE
jgi:conjugative transfer pilus assembly protein TraH